MRLRTFRFERFDSDAWMRRLSDAVEGRGKTWTQVSEETGVSTTTLSRIRSGERLPDASSLAVLSAWAGINPANYVKAQS